ncbi:GNAT family N-acetyltransferase [Corynebacterium otitidis]|uniref:GNAT family N-acetyltransferase n=1 Tax=Corynebacterium otitidis TaxID=29321 RepID=UPI001ED9C435|nr:GNAT family protein [Corynebacterium otitidis]
MSDANETREMDRLSQYGRTLYEEGSVRLREPREDDLPALARWWRDPSQAILQRPELTLRPEESDRELFRSWGRNDTPDGFGYAVLNTDNELVGYVRLHGVSGPARAGSLDVMIGAEHQGFSYGADAVRAGLRLAFREFGVHKVEAAVRAFNERALGVYTSIGFKEEGRRRAVAFHNGRYYDDVLLGMLVDEYRDEFAAEYPERG